MSSLFVPKSSSALTRPRASSHGGLGGLVKPEITDVGKSEWTSWPNRKKPPPLRIASYDDDNLLVPPAPWSAKSFQSSNSTWSPRTPSSSNSGQTPVYSTSQKSPLISRFNSAGLQYLPTSSPVTPKLPPKLAPAELPGSLLLPSQGFAPPPATPPRPLDLRRRDTDESDLSSLPSLTNSLSTESTSDSMDLLRGLSHPHRKMATSNGMGIGWNGANKSSTVSKPFSAMSVEELLSNFHACDSTTVARLWLPEMRRKCTAMKELMKKSEQTKTRSDNDLLEAGNDLKKFMQEARALSNTYDHALRSAESLIERDTLNLQERLHLTETELKQTRAQSRALNALLMKKDEKINALRHTLNEAVRVLGAFLQRNITQWRHNSYDAETETVIKLLEDFGESRTQPRARYIRIPEAVHLDLVSDVRDATNEIEKYRNLAQTQESLIKDQSKQLDQQLEKYQQSLMTVKSRDHEVILLCQRNTELEKKIETYEIALQRSQVAVTERDQILQENGDLKEELKQLTVSSELRLDEKDNTIAELRQKLGSAREEILARRADVRNVITQTQAMLAPPIYTGNGSASATGTPVRGYKGMGRIQEKDKKRKDLPSNQSSTFFGFHHVNAGVMSTTSIQPDSMYSTKELVGCEKKLFHESCGSSSNSAMTISTIPSGGQRLSEDPFSDRSTTTTNFRPRNESLNAFRDATSFQSPSPVTPDGNTSNANKQLPAAPPTLLPRIPTTSSLLNTTLLDSSSSRPSPSSSSSPQLPPQPSTVSYLNRSPARRILSLIPEASVEDSESPRAPSATSSDREVYRRSIHALDLLTSSDLIEEDVDEMQNLTVGDAKHAAGLSGSGGGNGVVVGGVMSKSSSEGSLSEIMTVSQMYHGVVRGE